MEPEAINTLSVNEAYFNPMPGDARPYLTVSILGRECRGLLDSGAMCSVINGSAFRTLAVYGAVLDTYEPAPTIITANGSQSTAVGYARLLVEYNNLTHRIKFLVIEEVKTPIIFGIEFWKIFNIGTEILKLIEVNSLTNQNFVESGTLQTSADLTPQQLKQLNLRIESFKKLTLGNTLEKTGLVQHVINTGDHPPVRQKCHQFSPAMLQVVHKEVDHMLKMGVIEPSNSPWNSPLVIVKKANGEPRVCLDSRKLNSVTKFDSYPLPNIDFILNSLRGAKYMTSIDLKSAYWQVELDESSKEKTAFSVPGRGLFQFKRMCFGLSTAAQTLQRLMDRLFTAEFQNSDLTLSVFTYLDDIVVVNRGDFAQHLELLDRVYKKLEEAKLTVNIEKSHFCRNELDYLGYKVDRDGLRTNPEKTKAIVGLSTPKSTKEVKSFLGMVGWYRRFIPNFSTIAAPLNRLTSKKLKKFEWNGDAQEAFEKLKGCLVTSPVLSCPDFSKEFCIQCDASDKGIGSVLTQEIDGTEKVIAYASRSLTGAEKNYSVTEKECLAALYSVEKFRCYVEGHPFTIITDHASLQWILSLKSPSGRLARWAMRLMQFQFQIKHRKGHLHVVPDALSRLNVDNLAEIYYPSKDPWYDKMYESCAKTPHRYPKFRIIDGRLYKLIKSKYALEQDTSFKLVVPSCNRTEIISENHDKPTAGHFGINKTVKRIALRYYWPKLLKEVKNYIRSCDTCLANKSTNQARPGLMGQPKKVHRPFETLSVDLHGPLPRSKKGNVYVMVVADYFSKYVFLFPIRKATASTIIQKLEENVLLVHGVPRTVICDNGTVFTSREFRDLIDRYKVPNLFYTTVYTPQVNPVERVNRVLGDAISSFLKGSHKEWDVHLPHIQSAMNNSVHEATSFTPYFLVHGREIILDTEHYRLGSTDVQEKISFPERKEYADSLKELQTIFNKVKEKLGVAYEKGKRIYDKRKRNLGLKVGQIVWKRDYVLSKASDDFASKLAPRNIKCVVEERVSPLVYRLRALNGKKLGLTHIKDIIHVCP